MNRPPVYYVLHMMNMPVVENAMNVYNRRMNFRTNNYVESFHNRWNKAVSVRHPSLWNFLRVLKDQLVVNEANKNGMLNGNPPPPRKLKWRHFEERIVQLKREYGNGQRNLTNYWNAICTICSISIMIILKKVSAGFSKTSSPCIAGPFTPRYGQKLSCSFFTNNLPMMGVVSFYIP